MAIKSQHRDIAVSLLSVPVAIAAGIAVYPYMTQDSQALRVLGTIFCASCAGFVMAVAALVLSPVLTRMLVKEVG